MTPFKTDKLSNGIRIITRKNHNTPRISLNLFMNSGSKQERPAGTASLVGRLLLQGTKSRSAEDIAHELDSNAIEMNVEAKQDYLRARTLFLNEDFDSVIDIFEDVLMNSTFENLDKEVRKLEGEIKLDLDSPKTVASDNLIRAIYPNHPYGYTHTKTLEDLQKINKNLLSDFYYKNSLSPDRMVFSVVGDIEHEKMVSVLNEKFGKLQVCPLEKSTPSIYEIKENKTITAARDDAAQAQIIQGWMAPSISQEDYPVVLLLNIILGASGLSSRLFVELRDKKGLAYTVRSGYEALQDSGLYTIYIGTAPKNIKVCLEGFEAEINKLKTIPVPKEELEGAIANYIGKRAFFHETNSQQAYYLGYYEIMGLGPMYDEEILNRVKTITSEEIMAAANKYFSQNSVVSILAPQKYLI